MALSFSIHVQCNAFHKLSDNVPRSIYAYLSKELACASLMMLTVTIGGFMWTFSLVPTRRRTVAENRVLVFNTCGGCFSITKELTAGKLFKLVNETASGDPLFGHSSWFLLNAF